MPSGLSSNRAAGGKTPLNVRTLPIHANMQPMTTGCDPIFASYRSVLRNASFQSAKQAVLQAKTACFTSPNDTFHKTLVAKWLYKSQPATAFNVIKVNRSVRVGLAGKADLQSYSRHRLFADIHKRLKRSGDMATPGSRPLSFGKPVDGRTNKKSPINFNMSRLFAIFVRFKTDNNTIWMKQ